MNEHQQIIIDISYDYEDRCYHVTSPTDPELITYGESLQDAQHNAADALMELYPSSDDLSEYTIIDN